VAAIIRGTDSTVADHYVAVTAHYDHIGRWNGGPADSAPPSSIHPGADDNASGTAAVLELARRLSANPPARSVIVIAFGTEELGLVGSRVFVDEPPIALKQIDVVLNLDMVGRLRENRLRVYGVNGRLRSIVERTNVDPRFSLMLTRESSRRSDDYPFSLHGVPALHFSTGEHVDYHRVTDTVDRIELAGLLRIVDYVERVARAVAR
jgi:Zn-dependent M28 family amino/carboxypeptidase